MEPDSNDPRLIDGTAVANAIIDATATRAEAFAQAAGTRPCLAAVLVGDDPASVTYIKMKRNRSERVGIESRLLELPADASTGDVVATVTELSQDSGIHGILLQHPVPPQVDERPRSRRSRPPRTLTA